MKKTRESQAKLREIAARMKQLGPKYAVICFDGEGDDGVMSDIIWLDNVDNITFLTTEEELESLYGLPSEETPEGSLAQLHYELDCEVNDFASQYVFSTFDWDNGNGACGVVIIDSQYPLVQLRVGIKYQGFHEDERTWRLGDPLSDDAD